MHKHIDLIGLLFVLAGALTALVAAAVFVLGLGALSLSTSGGPRTASIMTGTTFIVVAVLLVAWALANAWVGRDLRRSRRPLARLVALTLAVMHLFVLPFGTALGVYSLWVLLHPQTRPIFENGRARI